MRKPWWRRRPGLTTKADVVLVGIPDSGYISEIHVRVEQRRRRWWVGCLSTTNPVTVDGELLGSEAPQSGLVDGARLTLAKTAFRVKGTAAAAKESAA